MPSPASAHAFSDQLMHIFDCKIEESVTLSDKVRMQTAFV